jgi:exopolysaccharide biosynthesis polyprenyl glycosylphosphotransferase
MVVAVGLLMDLALHYSVITFEQATVKAGKALTLSLSPGSLALALFLTWTVTLILWKTWNPRVAGSGVSEYVMVTKASFAVVVALAFAALIFKLDVSRTFILVGFLLAVAFLVGHRWLNRQWLLAQRRQGKFIRRTMLLGPRNQVLEMAIKLTNAKNDGYSPAAAVIIGEPCSPTQASQLAQLGVTVASYEDPKTSDVNDQNIDAVVVIGSDNMAPERLKRISWALENTRAELIVSPVLIDFAGDRISTRQVAGMPLLFVEVPKFEGLKYLLKTCFDLLVALVTCVFFLPLMLVTALAILLDDGGPILYSQVRVGRSGRTFKILKFRSMVKNADERHAQLREKSVNPVNQNMFKDPNDPRITRVGRFIRRFSIDELPQIFNVLNGTMSMVGPRPPLASEVEEYERRDHRRLLVKPGITGLWQVSGRSTLSWEETVRIDLYYVENWTLAGDIFIILRTVKAVLAREGAF